MTTKFSNNAVSKLASGVAIGATSMTVTATEGSKFPVVVAPDVAYVTLENATNTEIIKITAHALGADSMTIVKAQEGTTDRAWLTGDTVSLRLTAAQAELGANAQEVAAAALTAHEAAADPHPGYTTAAELAASIATRQAADTTLDALSALDASLGLVEQTGADTFTKRAISNDIKSFLDAADKAAARTALGVATALAAWPVGSIFITVSATSPATLLGGGTWSAFGAGRTLVGIDSGQVEFDTIEETGGAKTHTLTIGEIPSHTHPVGDGIGSGSPTGGLNYGNGTTVGNTGATGGGGSHNNLQPYIVCYFWKRTA